jgi:hypothetical protein
MVEAYEFRGGREKSKGKEVGEEKENITQRRRVC